MTDSNVYPFSPNCEDDSEADRFEHFHSKHTRLDNLPASLGTPDQWLATAVSHLKERTCAAARAGVGSVEMTASAVELLMWHVEAIEQGGTPWKGNAA